MPVDVSQINQLAADFKAAGPRVLLRAKAVVAKTAHDIEATAKTLAAVDTGAMRNSIGVDLNGLTATIGPTVNYAPYVEFGTSRQAPQPFMGPAADRRAAAFIIALQLVAEDIL